MNAVRNVLALALAGALLLVAVPSVLAYDQFYGCTENQWINDTTKMILYEEPIGSHNNGDDALYICSPVSNLGNVTHSGPGGCTPNAVNTWNNCVSSFWGSSALGTTCEYRNANYSSLMSNGPPNGQRWNTSENDVLSSEWFTTGLLC